jgi:CheY-like chemotaxis protein
MSLPQHLSQSTPLRRVMCIEDDPDIRLVLDFSLRQLGGYELCLCESGEEALDAAPLFAPELVLLDVMMPGLTGPETLQALRARGLVDGVPVVFLTAKAMQGELEALMTHGVSGIIVKPFDPVSLPEDIRIYWQHGKASAR